MIKNYDYPKPEALSQHLSLGKCREWITFEQTKGIDGLVFR